MPYTQQQLENALRKADAAGDAAAAQAIAGELHKLRGGAAPRAETAPSSPSSFWGDVAGGAWAATKGAAKGAVGDVVGAGQIASDIPGVKSALKSIPGFAENAREARDWSRSRDPNYPTMGELGRMVGAAAPVALMPSAGLPALAEAAAYGGLTGLIQPTEGGDWSHDIPEHARDAILGAGFGMIPGLGGMALQRLAPLAGFIARYLPGLKIGGLFGHPFLGAHFGGKALAPVQPAVETFMKRTGKTLVPGEHDPSWLSINKNLPTGPPVPKGRVPAAAAGAEAELGYLRYGEQ